MICYCARDYAAECKSTYIKSFLESKAIAAIKNDKT
jgi:hypothetical protein